jgi:hypothetical protein
MPQIYAYAQEIRKPQGEMISSPWGFDYESSFIQFEGDHEHDCFLSSFSSSS